MKIKELADIHTQIAKNYDLTFQRYLSKTLDWQATAICIYGNRGVGKTTLLMQYYLQKFNSPEKCLYVSADNIHILSTGLFLLAQTFFKYGGESLIIDEIHKYPNWSQEIKNIIDTYPKKQVIFSGSSAAELKKSTYDLSRRVLYYELAGMSFREYLELKYNVITPTYSLEEILTKKVIPTEIKGSSILAAFTAYLDYGYYPFSVGDEDHFRHRLSNVFEKVLYEDLLTSFKIKVENIPKLKKLLWLIASSPPFTPNIDKLSRTLEISREYIYVYLDYLEKAGLIMMLFSKDKGFKRLRKAEKILIANTSLLSIIAAHGHSDAVIGSAREVFFMSQVKPFANIWSHYKVDFSLDGNINIEIGGPNKKMQEPSNNEILYYAMDGIESAGFQQIPLYWFGLMY